MSIPTDGLIFYASLDGEHTEAETGQTLIKNRDVIPAHIENIRCSYIPKGTGGVPGYSISPQPQLTSSQAQSISIWMKVANTWTTRDSDEGFASPILAIVAAGGSYGNITKLRFQSEQGTFDCVETNFLEWHHYVMTYSPENKFKGYVDGVLVVEYTLDPSGTTNYPYTIGGGRNWAAYFAKARIYDRELSKDEVTSLYNEFNEDSGGSDSGNTGILIDGLFLSSSKPEQNQKGIVINNNFFIPFIEKGEFDAGVVVDVDGVSKVQPLTFDGLTPSASGSTEDYVAKVYATGMSEPDYIGTVQVGGSTFYKCASVDTSAKTWTGYRAVLNDGIYTFEDIVTTGLSYTSVTPQVGNIYSQDALARISSLYSAIPTDGLVFYAPLAEDTATAETGQTMNFSGNVVYDVFDGVNGAFFNNAYFSSSIGSTLSEWTLSFWLKVTENQTSGAGYFNSKTNGEILIYINSSNRNLRFYPPDDLGTNVAPENWNHFVVASSGNTCSVYQNGIFYSNKTWNQAKSFDQFYIGSRYSEGTIKAYTAGLRIYNRLLSEMEAASLASEFTPTQVNT